MSIIREAKADLPTVGVLLAVYKGDGLVEFKTAVESLNEQSYPRFRIKVFLGVDGPLSPEVEKYLEESWQQFQAVSRSSMNQGLAKTLNRLIPLATGCEYVARMDADDVSHPDRITRQVNHLRSHPDIDILGGSIVEFSGSEQSNPRLYPRRDRIRNTIARSSPVAHPTVMFRASALERLGVYPDAKGNEDIAMWFKAMTLGLVIDNLPEPLLYFRVTERTLARRGLQKALGEFVVYMRGIWQLRLNPLESIFPVMRLIYRCMPRALTAAVFRAVKFRNRLQL